MLVTDEFWECGGNIVGEFDIYLFSDYFFRGGRHYFKFNCMKVLKNQASVLAVKRVCLDTCFYYVKYNMYERGIYMYVYIVHTICMYMSA